MGLPRTFVCFSSTDLRSYHLMQAWKANENIDFNFTDCQLEQEIDSENEAYIKRVCRERINMAGTFLLLIGEDTRHKYKYVRWEIEVALEKECRLIGVNLDGARRIVEATCPPLFRNQGAIFVPFSPAIVAHALEHYKRNTSSDYHYPDETYKRLGY